MSDPDWVPSLHLWHGHTEVKGHAEPLNLGTKREQALTGSNTAPAAPPELVVRLEMDEAAPPPDAAAQRSLLDEAALKLEEHTKEKQGAGMFENKEDHNYCQPPSSAVVEALETIKKLEERFNSVTAVQPRLSRFCVSDDDFKYYTRFPSERIFKIIWNSIEPSASKLVYWSQAQEMGMAAIRQAHGRTPNPCRELPLIDEFFLYCYLTAAGLKEKVLANIFDVNVSTVTRIVITWANYLYIVLGSIPIWITQEQVRNAIPPKFQKTFPNIRVIMDCTELRCEAPKALHSETGSTGASHTTFKGLIGVSPSGMVTFVSALHRGSISDKEITRLSGIIDLLEEEDEVLADEGFLIESQLSTVGAKLISPTVEHKSQFTKEQAQAIASMRNLVDRVIGRVKEFQIFHSPIPLTLAGTINQIWVNCCLLVNYQGPMELGEKPGKYR